MNITYVQFQAAHEARLAKEKLSGSPQVVRNHLSTLSKFLAWSGKSFENRVGREFLTDFNVSCANFAEHVCPGKRKTAADKRSHLRAWKKTLDGLVSADKRRPDSRATKFHLDLRAAVARSDVPLKVLVSNIGGSLQAVNRWLAGAYPNQQSLPTLRRLENALGLSRGDLENLLPAPVKNLPAKPGADSYAKRHVENIKDHYFISTSELTGAFTDEWSAFLKYKTVEHPIGLRRSPRSVWRSLPFDKVKPDLIKNSLVHPAEGYACATAECNLTLLRKFFGFLSKPAGTGIAGSGLGLPSDEIQTLAVAAVPEFVGALFEFTKARSGGIVHAGHDVPASFFQSLLKSGDGYLRQQPEFYERVEKYARGRTWDEMCDQTHDLCAKWKQAAVGNKSRDPKAPILFMLRLEAPLKPLFRAIKDLDAAAAAMAPGCVRQATLKRDALLLAMMLANPLRGRTYTIAKYIADGDEIDSQGLSTNLHLTESGEWRLHFEKGDFKNDRGARNEDYDAQLPQMLNARIADYLFEYRPVLIRNAPDSPWLFPDSRSGGKIADIGVIISRIAKRYIPEVVRLGTHAIRHLVATDFLIQNPGQYTVIAELLHDTLETVLKNYTHLKQETSFKAHEEHLQKVYADSTS